MIKKIRQKWLVKKSKFVSRKKNPPRAQIFRYLCYKNRNKNETEGFNQKITNGELCGEKIEEKKSLN